MTAIHNCPVINNFFIIQSQNKKLQQQQLHNCCKVNQHIQSQQHNESSQCWSLSSEAAAAVGELLPASAAAHICCTASAASCSSRSQCCRAGCETAAPRARTCTWGLEQRYIFLNLPNRNASLTGIVSPLTVRQSRDWRHGFDFLFVFFRSKTQKQWWARTIAENRVVPKVKKIGDYRLQTRGGPDREYSPDIRPHAHDWFGSTTYRIDMLLTGEMVRDELADDDLLLAHSARQFLNYI